MGTPAKKFEMKPKIKHTIYALFFLPALFTGFMFGDSPITTPIHEACHVIGAFITGGGGKVVDWFGLAKTYGGNTAIVYMAGYYGEMIFLVFMFWFLSIRRYTPIGFFFFGMAHTKYLFHAPQRLDFAYNPGELDLIVVYIFWTAALGFFLYLWYIKIDDDINKWAEKKGTNAKILPEVRNWLKEN
jgi:hypothetical protein